MRNQTIPVWLLLIAASGLGGCSSDVFSRDMGGLQKVEFFKLRDDSRVAATRDAGIDSSRPVAAEEFVDADGRCAGAPALVQAAGDDPNAPPAPAVATVVGGVGLGMTECEVVRRAGAPGTVEIGAESGDRNVTLTYLSGTWPGIYRFSGGRLKEVERVAAPAPPPKVAKQKRPVKRAAARPPA